MSDRGILADVSTRLFTDLVTPELIAAAERGEWPAALWRAVEENGLTLPLVPEAKGGAAPRGPTPSSSSRRPAATPRPFPSPRPSSPRGSWRTPVSACPGARWRSPRVAPTSGSLSTAWATAGA
jgi:hypothetical protein